MVEVRRTGPPDAQRIAHRLLPSNEMETASTHTTQGSSAQRVSTTIHHGSSQKYHEDNRSRSLTDMPVRPTGSSFLSGGDLPEFGKRK
jgi:hypothetical protein